MTRDEARAVARLIPEQVISNGDGTAGGGGFLEQLRAAFPDFNWRIILDRSGRWTRWALSVDDDDPRERMPESAEDDE